MRIDDAAKGEGHQNLDQASNQVERLALCCVVPAWEEGYGRQNIGPQVPSFRSTEGGMQWRQKYKIPDHRLNRVFGHYGSGHVTRYLWDSVELTRSRGHLILAHPKTIQAREMLPQPPASISSTASGPTP
jgi:hypothetical protein